MVVSGQVATRLAKGLLDVPLADPMSGYFVMRRGLYESCRGRIHPAGYKILLEIVVSGRPAMIEEIPYVFKDRKQGHSKLTPKVALQYLSSLWRLRREASTCTICTKGVSS